VAELKQDSSRRAALRVLMVTPFPVFPLTHGGSVRAHRLAVGLARAGADVDVVFPWYPGQRLRRFEGSGVSWHPQVLPGNALPLLLPERLVPAIAALSWRPGWIGFRHVLRRLGEHDVVQFEFPTVLVWRRWLPGNPTLVYSSHNVEVDYARDRVAPLLRGAVLRRMAKLESAAVAESDLVVACTADDERRLSELYGPTATAVVPNGFGDGIDAAKRNRLRTGARRRLGIGGDEHVLLFLGGRAPHNTAAVAALEESVLPALTGKVTLLVAGRCAKPGESVQGERRVIRLGFVEDLESVLAAADVALNPVTVGSGSSVKLADYLSAGLPVVSTPVGVRGFEGHLQGVQIAEIAGFPAAIQSALRSPPPAPTPAGAEDLGTDALGKRLLAAYASAGAGG
jgi:polysaccharide biosynthesis protein PslH